MKKGWEYKTLGECCKITDFVSNGSFASLKQNVNYYYEKNYAVLVRLADYSNNFNEAKFVYTDKHGYDFTSKSHLHGGEIIMSNVGSVGSLFICPELKMPMTLAPNTISIDTEYNKFYYYLFISPSFSSILSEIVTKTTLKKFNKTNFKKIIVNVPSSLDEQRRIVSYLDSSFDLIDKIKVNASKSLSEAKALFQSALAEAMEPKEGWEEKTLGEIATDMYRGSGIKRDQISQIGFPCVRYGEIYTTYNYSFNECVSHTNESLINPKKYFDKGDILFAITGESVEDIGKCIAYTGKERCLCGGDIVVMKHNQYPQFLAYALSTKEAIRQKGLGKVKLKVVHTNVPALKSIKIYLPTDIKTQKQIVSRLDSLSSKVRAIEEKYQKMIAECDAMKQAMLREVFE